MFYNAVFVVITFVLSCVADDTNYSYNLKSLYVIFPENIKHGPSALSRSINDMLRNNSIELSNMCKIYIKASITLNELHRLSHLNGTVIWFEQPEYFEYILSQKSINFSNVLYGPNVSPISWMEFPYHRSYEVKWREYMSKIFGYVVHYPRVRNHIMTKSKTTDYKHKYLFFRACTNVNPKLSAIKSWDDREYDFLIFLKYADLNMKRYGKKLVKLLKKYNNVVLKYGSYNHEDLLNFASESRCVIYYSFYDTGAIALQEIQNYGVYAIVLQSEFVDEKNGVYISELEYNVDAAAEKCEDVIKVKRDSKFLAKYNVEKNSCLKSFISLFHQINGLMKINKYIS